VLVRYCDDLVVMCRSREQADAALARLSQLLAQLGLQLKQAKTRIVRLEVGGSGFDFLGFHHRLMRSRGIRGRRGVTFLARWPSDKAMRHARDRLRALTRSSRLLLSVEAIVGHEYVPARLGCLLSVRAFRGTLHHDQPLRAGTVGVVRWEAT
jgi:RNA-directed DNA polymerase